MEYENRSQNLRRQHVTDSDSEKATSTLRSYVDDEDVKSVLSEYGELKSKFPQDSNIVRQDLEN